MLKLSLLFKGLSLFLMMFITSNLAYATEEELTDNDKVAEITLECTTEVCSIDLEITKFLIFTSYLKNQDVMFYLQSDAAIIDSKLLSTFISENFPIEASKDNLKDNDELNDSVNSFLKQSTRKTRLSKYARAMYELKSYVNNMANVNDFPEMEIVVTQGLIDSNNRAKQLVTGALLAIPTGRIASLMATLGKGLTEKFLLESMTAMYLADLISNNLKSDTLEVGDIMVISKGKMKIVKKGSSNNTGSGGGSGNEGGGHRSGGMDLLGDTPVRVCTGILGSMSCYWIYL
ncbi:hypothetical protein [Shewanella surugensis]|uniref:Curli production assembly/transport component CsgG n=1 Tax=Shewanella surugensis TaxID=212020 RepID=A0ABT0L5L3_9GAMM|nr:hypothetical protein [Shewanella surugensis]MCL1122977.1 hypothetical protein [Shewanella surugensis]